MDDHADDGGGRTAWSAFWLLLGVGAFVALAFVVLVVRAFSDDDRFGQLDQLTPVVAGTAVVERPHQDCSANSNDCSGLAIVDGSKRSDTLDRLERNALRSGFAKGAVLDPRVRNYERDGLCLAVIDDGSPADAAGLFAGRIIVALDDCSPVGELRRRPMQRWRTARRASPPFPDPDPDPGTLRAPGPVRSAD